MEGPTLSLGRFKMPKLRPVYLSAPPGLHEVSRHCPARTAVVLADWLEGLPGTCCRRDETITGQYKMKERQEMDSKGRTIKNWHLWILLGGIALLCAAFWFLNFRRATSNTNSEKNITTTSIGEGLPYAMQRREKINLALAGKGPLVAALQRALVWEMKDAGIGDIELVQGIEPRYSTPVLIVKVGRPGLVWTPFFATCRFTVQTGYSSAGDTTFMGKTPSILDDREGPALSMYGEYQISDRSWGLISRPGYYQSLADYLARQIVATLKDLYRISTSPDESY